MTVKLSNTNCEGRDSEYFHLFSLGYNVSDRIVNILMRRFDRSGTFEIRFDDFIQLCSVLRVNTILLLNSLLYLIRFVYSLS